MIKTTKRKAEFVDADCHPKKAKSEQHVSPSHPQQKVAPTTRKSSEVSGKADDKTQVSGTSSVKIEGSSSGKMQSNITKRKAESVVTDRHFKKSESEQPVSLSSLSHPRQPMAPMKPSEVSGKADDKTPIAGPSSTTIEGSSSGTKRSKKKSKKSFGKKNPDASAAASGSNMASQGTSNSTELSKPKLKIRKLVPPRPFPTVPTSVSATGPRSAHQEGKNFICITRKTPLGSYLRRCKEVVMKDGYTMIHLNALGAAIPHMLMLAVSLPSILPFPRDEIHTDVRTGTVEVHDEVIPDDEDEDISLRKRSKSTMSVVIRIGDGVGEEKPSSGAKLDGGDARANRGKEVGGNRTNNGTNGKGKGKSRSGNGSELPAPDEIVFQEADQEENEEWDDDGDADEDEGGEYDAEMDRD